MIIGIDASRNRSGGAKAHLIGILNEGNPQEYGITKVHLWSYKSLLDSIEDQPWLVKHCPDELEMPLYKQLWWQYNVLPKEVKRNNCDILLSTDAGTICRSPGVVMSRDMLSYEPGEMERFGLSTARLRLWLLKYVQSRSIRKAKGVIFLTEYASKVIQQHTGKIKDYRIIPHGVSTLFRNTGKGGLLEENQRIQCVYVSYVEKYKHQWHVATAIYQLRLRGFDLGLTIAGGGGGEAQKRLDREIAAVDPQGEYIRQTGPVPHAQIPKLHAEADVFIFASSCENMPNTLVEAMAAGMPIACSERGPMPEVLKDGGMYFDPEKPDTIASAIETIITDDELRKTLSLRAKALADQYSWKRCARETWSYLRTMSNLKNENN